MTIAPDCPEPYFPQISMIVESEGGYQFADSFFVSIGKIGFQDNMENGNGYWTHYGSPDETKM